MARPPHVADLAAAAAGLCWGLARPGPVGAALALLGAAFAARSLTGHLRDDAARGWLVGLLWMSLGARWVVPSLALWGVDAPEAAWAALVLLQGALVAPVWALASALGRPWGLPAAWAVGAVALPMVMPVPVTPADLVAVPLLLGPARLGGPALLAWVAVAVGGALPSPRAVVALALWVGSGLLPSPAGPDLTVRLVQPGTAPLDGRVAGTADAREAALRALSTLPNDPVDLRVLPEAAWPHPLRDAGPLAAAFADAPTVLGATLSGHEHAVAVVGGATEAVAKAHLTPLTEQPGWTRGAEQGRVLNVDGRLIAPLLCFEDLVPTALFAAAHADLVVLLTNDGWTHGTAGTAWHAQRAGLVAASLGRPVIRAATSGPSGVIDPTGRWVTRLGEGAVAETVTVPMGRAPWSGGGWLATAVVVVGAMGAARATGAASPGPGRPGHRPLPP